MIKIIVILLLILSAVNSWGWWDKSTHRILSQDAADRYFNPVDPTLLKTPLELDGKKQRAEFWLQDGSELEDEANLLGIPTRSLNHFHNPIKPLATAGLDDTFSGMSALIWAQDPSEQIKVTPGGNWTWQKVREHQYNYLTAPDQTNHDANQARMLKGLGYQMHLAQDMSQPNHVRNDAHILDGMGIKTSNGFETWAKTKDKWIKDLLSNPATIIPDVTVDLTKPFADPALAPIPVARLFDTREHLTGGAILPSKAMSQGLAEYTNANFFSEDTVFAAERYSVGNNQYFPYPKKDETDLQDFIDQNMDPVPGTAANGTNYLNYVIKKTQAKTSGEPLECLTMPGPNTLKFFNEFGGAASGMFYGSFRYNAKCYEEHARLLLPRTIAYSKALLDYFFRGKLEASLSIQNPSTSSTMRLMLKNATPGEQMTGGKLAMVLRYRQFTESGTTLVSAQQDADFSYMVIELQQQTVPSGAAAEYAFSLPQPLPLWTKDLAAQVVYQGTLGNETNAVAVSPWNPLQYKPDEIELKLPAAGVYATTTGATPFTEIRLNARNNLPTGETMTDGTISLYLLYRTATADPFQSVAVTSLPADGYNLVKVTEKNSTRTLPTGSAVELAFDLSTVPLPLWATDVYLYVVYQGTLTNGVTTKPNATVVGMIDIAEPTPVDAYNNTDYTCLNNTWYRYDDPAAMTIVDADSNGIADISDIYPHTISNIAFLGGAMGTGTLDASAANNLSAAGPLQPGQMLRLGYILTDYANRFAFDEQWTNLSTNDNWTTTSSTTTFSGTGFVNQANKGLGGMYPMRGSKMWWGTSVVYENDSYPAGSYCDTDLLNQPVP